MTSWLSPEADRASVDGAPRLIDFSTAPDRTLDNYLLIQGVVDAFTEQLELSRTEAASLRHDAEGSIRDCVDDVTDDSIESTEGAPGYAAAPS